jgi:hypothetical protein
MNFLFHQSHPFERLSAVRFCLGLIVAILLILGPYDSFYADTAPWLFQAQPPCSWFPNLGFHFWTLKYATILLSLVFAFGRWPKVTAPLFALTFLAFNFYITCFHTTYWITNTHLNFFTLGLAIVPFLDPNKASCKELASFILAFMITYIATLYLQAGVSKYQWGGLEWFITGKRVLTETTLLGTPFGKWLTQWPALFQLMSLSTAPFELGVPFLFFFEKTRPYAALIAILFHCATFAVLGISFWFLWGLYPALFFYKAPSPLFVHHKLARKPLFS